MQSYSNDRKGDNVHNETNWVIGEDASHKNFMLAMGLNSAIEYIQTMNDSGFVTGCESFVVDLKRILEQNQDVSNLKVG